MAFHQLKYKGEYRSQKPHRSTCGCNRCFKRITKNHKIKEIPKIDYYEYIKSIDWLKRKERYYLKHKKQCQACGSYKLINLHHMVYGDFGNEPDNTMVCLCESCHNEFHKIYLITKDLRKQTNEFIKHKQDTIKRLIKEFSTS